MGHRWAPVEPDGNTLVATGNGAALSGAWDHTDSVLGFSPTLGPLSAFASTRWAHDNAHDLDLGSVSPTLLPDRYVFIIGKGGVGYHLRQSNLGGICGQVSSGTTRRAQMAFGGAAGAPGCRPPPLCRPHPGSGGDGGRELLGPLVRRQRGQRPAGPRGRSGVQRGHQHRSTPCPDADLGPGPGPDPIGPLPHFTSATLIGSDAYVGTDHGVVMVQGV